MTMNTERGLLTIRICTYILIHFINFRNELLFVAQPLTGLLAAVRVEFQTLTAAFRPVRYCLKKLFY